MIMKAWWVSGLIFFFVGLFVFSAHAQTPPGFVSIDCGSTESFTDELGLEWIPDQLTYGETARVSVANETRKQYKTLRYFPSDDNKYCYTLSVETRTRYLLRATFLYGIFDSDNIYPKFDVWVDATLWSTIVISGHDEMETKELIFLALEPTVSVCLSNASRRMPFISTLELRRFNGSMYYTDFENKFYLGLSFRYNLGADSEDPIRYPDDPYDRIWEAFTLKRDSPVADVGTEAVSTKLPIFTDVKERAPQKVMQTALVGRNGSLTFLFNLNGFPGTGWVFTYLAEIEDLGPHDVRKFGLRILGQLADVSRPPVNIIENAGGKRRLFQPGYQNITLPFAQLSFGFDKASDSTMGPILNAMEIHRHIEKRDGSADGSVIASFVSHYSSADWAREGGDPCLPVPLSWLKCNSNAQPLVTKVTLSGKNLTGNIPSELTKLSGLEELWLSGNSLTGSIPDFSGCPNLKIIHLDDNQLTGKVPSSLAQLSNLRELYLQNNHLSGELPSALMNMNLVLNYTGNVDLNKGGDGGKTKRNAIIGATIGVVVLLMATIVMSWILVCRGKLQGTKSVEQSTENYDDDSKTLNSLYSCDRLEGSPGLGLDGSIANPTRRPEAP